MITSLTNLNKPPNETSNTVAVRLIFGGVVACIAVALLVPIPVGGRVAPAIGDMVHAPLFGFVTLASFLFLQRVRPLTATDSLKPIITRILVCGAGAFAFGLTSELAQSISGRSAALHDAFANSTGIFAVACFLITFTMAKQGELSRLATMIIVSMTLVPVAMSWWSPLATLVDVYRREQEFPLLDSFERKAGLERWYFANSSGERSREHVDHGTYSLRADYQPGIHTSMTLFDFAGDWSAMEKMSVTMALSKSHLTESARIAIQVIDAGHDGNDNRTCRREWTLQRGQRKTVEIKCSELLDSSGESLDLLQIRYLDVQLVRSELATTVFIDNIRLIPKRSD